MPRITAANDKVIIQFIVDTLLSGTLQYNDVMELTCTKFSTSKSFFASRWKQAQQIFNDSLGDLEAKRSAMLDPGLYAKILTKIELCVLLTEQIRSTEVQISDRNKAADLLCKLMAWYTPKQIDHTTGGEPFTNRVILYDNGRDVPEVD
jgi:hypothetical protein